MNGVSRLSRWLVGLFLVLLTLSTLVACSGGSALAPATAGPAEGFVGEPGRVDGKPVDDGEGTGGGTPLQPAASVGPDTQLIVYTGTLDLQVGEVRGAVDQADQLVAGLGGHVASSDSSTKDNQDYATVTYRIPAEKWDEALAGLRAVGVKVLNESISSEDVTGQVVDLDARIANAKASETALQAIMDKATTIQDVLDVQRELTQVRGDIESMTAQRDTLANRAALATLTVSFATEVLQTQVATGGWDLGQVVDDALAALVRIGQSLATVVVWVLIVLVPIVVPVLLVLALATWLRRRWQRSHPRPEMPGPSASAPSV